MQQSGEEDDTTDRHRATDPRLDDNDAEVPQPLGPEPRGLGDNQTLPSPVNALEEQIRQREQGQQRF
jgi:hypothetical protein